MNIRTDLALEAVNAEKLSEGITKYKRGNAFDITEIRIAEDRHGEAIGRKKGRYVTLEGSSLGRVSENFRTMAEEFSRELSVFIPKGDVLVIGLGNSDITPDALGPQTASKVLATRHLKSELGSENEFLASLRPVSVLASGVLGQTGIETAEIVSGLLDRLSPSCDLFQPFRPDQRRRHTVAEQIHHIQSLICSAQIASQRCRLTGSAGKKHLSSFFQALFHSSKDSCCIALHIPGAPNFF